MAKALFPAPTLLEALQFAHFHGNPDAATYEDAIHLLSQWLSDSAMSEDHIRLSDNSRSFPVTGDFIKKLNQTCIIDFVNTNNSGAGPRSISATTTALNELALDETASSSTKRKSPVISPPIQYTFAAPHLSSDFNNHPTHRCPRHLVLCLHLRCPLAHPPSRHPSLRRPPPTLQASPSPSTFQASDALLTSNVSANPSPSQPLPSMLTSSGAQTGLSMPSTYSQHFAQVPPSPLRPKKGTNCLIRIPPARSNQGTHRSAKPPMIAHLKERQKEGTD
ncbi:hypothetical protein B0H11DRAFT_2187333 [Mycena galericulata]|nr:hypothetical protein B0H11DRAFT_2187333 [Mycena galericulata]